jgi:adenosylmethionine-8-amino-7-oxononanoate aminotransferase
MRIGARVAQEALDRGVILRPVGDTLVFCPPLIIIRSEIDQMLDAVTEALDVVAGEFAETRKVA